MEWKIPVCDGCKRENPLSIMIKDYLWHTICPFPAPLLPDGRRSRRPTGVLCFQCIRFRLGRQLTFDDLKPCGLTDLLHMGAFMFGQLPNPETLLSDFSKFDPYTIGFSIS